MSDFLDLGSVSDEMREHVANWLRGRPRLTATFLEEFLTQSHIERDNLPENTTRGHFSTDEEKLVIQALDRYRIDTTTKERRKSWHSGGTTAFDAIEKASSDTLVRSRLEQATSKYVLGGEPYVFTRDMMELTQLGVVALSIDDSRPNEYFFKAILDEPMVGEAGLNYFELESLVLYSLTCQEDDASGQSFEKLSIPYLRNKLQNAAMNKFPQGEFGRYSISKISSYGVIAKKCNIDETLDWVEKATNTTIEGSVPPFCLPDNSFGPDTMLLMFDSVYATFRTALVQSKFRSDVSQPDALRTLVPDWLYHQNRDKTPIKSQRVSQGQWNRFLKLQQQLVGKPLLRCLIEFPAAATKTSLPSASIHKNGITPCSTNGSCQEAHDWQLTFDGEESNSLFSPETIAFLEHYKGEAKKRKITVSKK